MNIKIIILGIVLLLVAGCTSSSLAVSDVNVTVNVTNIICSDPVDCNITSSLLWFFNTTSNFTEPIDFPRTVRVNDLIIQDNSSLVIGGIVNGTAFARISVEEFFLPAGNVTIRQIVMDRGIIARDTIDGFQLMTNQNLAETSNALSITSAGDFEGNGMTLFKRNANFKQPYVGQLVNLNGDLEILNTKSNNGSSIGLQSIKIGFYDDIFVSPNTVNLSLLNKSFIIIMNQTLIQLVNPTNIETNLFFNQTDNSSFKTGYVTMFCKPNNKCFIIRDDGTQRRLVDAGGGESHIEFDEQLTFENTTTFELLAGSGSAFTCVDNSGNLFRNNSACQPIAGGNATGNVFGTEFEFFQSLEQSSTGSALVDKLDVTTGPKPAGTYRVGFTVDVTNSDGTDIYTVQFLVNNTPIHQHTNGANEYENKPNGNNDWEVYSTFFYVTLSTIETIDLNIKFGTNDNIARASNAVIEIWRVS